MAGESEGYPTKDEIADYLERYAAHFDLPATLNTEITALEQADGGFRARTAVGETIHARAVVLATGAFQQPAIPTVASHLSPDLLQLTPDSYRNPADVPTGTVLVVGDGATGRQIASELAPTHRVLLSTGRARRVSLDRILGRNVFWWMDKLGVLRVSRESRLGKRLMAADPFPGKSLELKRLRAHGVEVVGRLVHVDGRTVRFADDVMAEVDAVIWATGYRDDSSWVAIPGTTDARGAFIHERGISPAPGLYFIGRSWQWTRGSALLHGVGDDAAYLVEHITRQLGTEATAVPRESQPASDPRL